MNKKIIGLTVTLGTGIFLIGQQTVNAADNTNTTANVSVLGGGLTITPLAQINFGTVTKTAKIIRNQIKASRNLSLMIIVGQRIQVGI